METYFFLKIFFLTLINNIKFYYWNIILSGAFIFPVGVRNVSRSFSFDEESDRLVWAGLDFPSEPVVLGCLKGITNTLKWNEYCYLCQSLGNLLKYILFIFSHYWFFSGKGSIFTSINVIFDILSKTDLVWIISQINKIL